MSKDSNLLGIRDIVFMNVIAILSLRQIPNVAPYGASAMLLWLMAAACLFFPLAMVCGELSTGWPKDGGIFVWVREAFGKRLAWIVVVCFLFSCVLFFPLMLQFGFTAMGYVISPELANDKVFIGVSSMVVFWILTFMNIRGMEWTKIINSVSAYLGVFIPSAVIILLGIVWVATGHPMSTDYATPANWMLTALTTICYFIPYLCMFPAYLRLRKTQPDVPRSFKIPGKVLPVVLPLLGWCSIAFAVFLVFIPPAELDMGGYGFYLAKLFGGGALAIGTAEYIYHRAMKRNAAAAAAKAAK